MAQIGGGGYAGSRPLETSDATKMLVDGPCICSRQGSRLLKAASVGPMSRETPSASNRLQPSGCRPDEERGGWRVSAWQLLRGRRARPRVARGLENGRGAGRGRGEDPGGGGS